MIKKFVPTSFCPACGSDFRTRIRAAQHLRVSSDTCNLCRSVVLSGFVPEATAETLVLLALQALSAQQRQCACRRRAVAETGLVGASVAPVTVGSASFVRRD